MLLPGPHRLPLRLAPPAQEPGNLRLPPQPTGRLGCAICTGNASGFRCLDSFFTFTGREKRTAAQCHLQWGGYRGVQSRWGSRPKPQRCRATCRHRGGPWSPGAGPRSPPSTRDPRGGCTARGQSEPFAMSPRGLRVRAARAAHNSSGMGTGSLK